MSSASDFGVKKIITMFEKSLNQLYRETNCRSLDNAIIYDIVNKFASKQLCHRDLSFLLNTGNSIDTKIYNAIVNLNNHFQENMERHLKTYNIHFTPNIISKQSSSSYSYAPSTTTRTSSSTPSTPTLTSSSVPVTITRTPSSVPVTTTRTPSYTSSTTRTPSYNSSTTTCTPYTPVTVKRTSYVPVTTRTSFEPVTVTETRSMNNDIFGHINFGNGRAVVQKSVRFTPSVEDREDARMKRIRDFVKSGKTLSR